MAYIMNPPSYVFRDKNPVEQWFADPDISKSFGAELGFTLPKLNRRPMMDESSTNPGRMVSKKAHLECSLNLPEVNAWRDGDDEDEDNWVGEISRRAVNTFDWVVTYPPKGPWRASVRGLDASRFVNLIFDEMQKNGMAVTMDLRGSARMIAPHETWTIEAVCSRGYDALINHTIAHENQHVSDHRAIIKTVLGPWDDFLDPEQSYLTNRRVRGDSRYDIMASFYSGRGFNPNDRRQSLAPTGVESIVQTIHFEFVQSGILYHQTHAGAPCRRRLMGISRQTSGRLLTVSVEPLLFLQGVANVLPPPVWDPGRIRFPLR